MFHPTWVQGSDMKSITDFVVVILMDTRPATCNASTLLSEEHRTNYLYGATRVHKGHSVSVGHVKSVHSEHQE